MKRSITLLLLPTVKNQWQMPTPMNLDSSGLRHSSRTEVMKQHGKVYSNATTLMNQEAHFRLASPQSFSSAREPISTICSFQYGLSSSMVQSLAVKVQVSSTLKVQRHAFALLAFEPVTSTNQNNSAKAALKTTAEVQASADKTKPNNASSFNDKPSSTFQLVVASVNWISKPVSNKPIETLRLERIKSKMQPIFQLIVRFKQQYQSKMQQDLVVFSSSKTILNAKLANNDFQLIVVTASVNKKNIKIPFTAFN
jgi:hypothetical protein